MSRRFAAVAVFALLSACGEKEVETTPAAPAVPGAWVVDYGASELGFVATQGGKPFDGAFGDWAATIVFDPDNLDDASIEVVIDPASAATGDRQRDAALPDADWFNVKAHPMATFRADDIVRTGDGAYEARGVLSMRGVERPTTLPFTLAVDGESASASGSLTFDRTDFGVGQGEFATDEWVGLDVEVRVRVEARKAG